MQPKDAEGLAEDEVLQNTEKGYEKTKLKDVPLSDATGEGRKEPGG